MMSPANFWVHFGAGMIKQSRKSSASPLPSYITGADNLYNTARLTPIRLAISLADTCRVQSAMTACRLTSGSKGTTGLALLVNIRRLSG